MPNDKMRNFLTDRNHCGLKCTNKPIKKELPTTVCPVKQRSLTCNRCACPGNKKTIRQVTGNDLLLKYEPSAHPPARSRIFPATHLAVIKEYATSKKVLVLDETGWMCCELVAN
jgi:hypothetical protein